MKKSLLLGLAFLSLNSFGSNQAIRKTTGLFEVLARQAKLAKNVPAQAARTAVAPQAPELIGKISGWTLPTRSSALSKASPLINPSTLFLKTGTHLMPLAGVAAHSSGTTFSAAALNAFLNTPLTSTRPTLIPYAPPFKNFGIQGGAIPATQVAAPKIIQTSELDSYEDQGANPYALPEENEEEIILNPEEPLVEKEEENLARSFADEEIAFKSEASPDKELDTFGRPNGASFDSFRDPSTTAEPEAFVVASPATIVAAQLTDTALMVIDNAPDLSATNAPSTPSTNGTTSALATAFSDLSRMFEALTHKGISQPSALTVVQADNNQAAVVIFQEKPKSLMVTETQAKPIIETTSTVQTVIAGALVVAGTAAFIAAKNPTVARQLVRAIHRSSATVIEQPALSLVHQGTKELTTSIPTQSRYFTQEMFKTARTNENSMIKNFTEEARFRNEQLKSTPTPASPKKTPTKQKHSSIKTSTKAPSAKTDTKKAVIENHLKQIELEQARLREQKQAQEEATRLREQAELKQVEEAQIREEQHIKEAKAKEDARLELQRIEQKQVEKARLEAETKAQEVKEKARLEAEAKENELKQAKETQAKEKARLEAEAEQQAKVREQEETARLEKQAQEEVAKLEAEQKQVEKARLEAEQQAKEVKAKEKARLEAEAKDKARLEAETKAKEDARLELQRIESEKAKVREQEVADAKAKEDAARLKQEETARLEKQAEEGVARLEAELKTKAQEVTKVAQVKGTQKALEKVTAKVKSKQKAPTQKLLSSLKNQLKKKPVSLRPFAPLSGSPKKQKPSGVKTPANVKSYLPKLKKLSPAAAKPAEPAKEEPKEEAKKEEIKKEEPKPEEEEREERSPQAKQRKPREEEGTEEDGEPLTKKIPRAKKPAAKQEEPTEEVATATPTPQHEVAKTALAPVVQKKALATVHGWAAPIKVEPTSPAQLHFPTTAELDAQAARQRTVELPLGESDLLVVPKKHYAHPESGIPATITTPLAEKTLPHVTVPCDESIVHEGDHKGTSQYPDNFPDLTPEKPSTAKVAFDFGKELVNTMVLQPLKQLSHYVIEMVSNWFK